MSAKRNKAVAALRGAIGRTQVEFAAMIGVSKDTVVSWENGRNRLEKRAALRIISATGALIDDLLHPREGVRFYTGEPYRAEHLAEWKSQRRAYDVQAVGMAAAGACDLKMLLLAAARPGAGKLKDRLPAVWASFMDWMRATEREFELGKQIDEVVKARAVPYRMVGTYGAWRARSGDEQIKWGFKDDPTKAAAKSLTLERYRAPVFRTWDEEEGQQMLREQHAYRLSGIEMPAQFCGSRALARISPQPASVQPSRRPRQPA